MKGLAEMDAKEVMKLHERGCLVGQIAEMLNVGPEEVRSAIAASWGKDKKKDSLAHKIAGRRSCK